MTAFREAAETGADELGHSEQGAAMPSSIGPKSLLPLHLFFLAMAALFLVAGAWVQHWNFKAGILITEFGMLVIPALIYMKVSANPVREQFKLKAPDFSDLWKVTLAGLLFVPVVGLLNSVLNIWLIYGLGIEAPQIPTEPGLLGPLVTFLIAAVTPGFCEEFFFRGLLLTEYEKRMGGFQAAVVTALLFGLFHFNPMNFFGPFALGLIFAWLMQVTGSIWTAMLGHLVNNSVAVLMLYLSAGSDPAEGMALVQNLGNLWPLLAVFTLFLLGLIALPCAYLASLLYRSIRKNHIRAGDLLRVSGAAYLVTAASQDGFALAGEDEVLHFDRKALLRDREVRLINGHWAQRQFAFNFKAGEWWPVWICVMIYIGVGALTIMAMMAEKA